MNNNKIAVIWLSLAVTFSFIVIIVDIAQTVEAPTTLYVGGSNPGNYSKIQWAIDNASDGDTVYVYNGTYYENVVVNKTINLMGEDRDTTIIYHDKFVKGINVTANWVNITGFTITKSDSSWGDVGINLFYVHHCNIYKNNATSNGQAIYMEGSDENNIFDNQLKQNGFGIYIKFSSNNTILRNNISLQNNIGIYLFSLSNYNNISNNIFHKNGAYGVLISNSSNNIVFNNSFFYNENAIILNSLSKFNMVLNNDISTSKRNSIEILSSHYNGIYANNFYCSFFVIDPQDWKDIYLSSSSNNTISGNTLSLKKRHGMGLDSSPNNTISHNNISFGRKGIILISSSNNIVASNNISSTNWIGIDCDSSSNIILDNNNLLNNFNSITLSYSCNNSIIINNNISKNWKGVSIYYTSHCTISHNNILSNTNCGITMGYSFNNSVENNTFTFDGIFIEGDKIEHWNSHIIMNNTANTRPIYYYKNDNGIKIPKDAVGVIIANCTDFIIDELNVSNIDIGIEVGFSFNVNITNNKIINDWKGIHIFKSDHIMICNNSISSNEFEGLYQLLSSNITIFNNNISLNSYGIALQDSTNNRIYHNNFINNKNQAYDGSGSENYWDNGYPSGGNFWSDYTGVDQFKGPDQNIPGSDMIGDTNYSLDSDSRDNYPLMAPIGNCIFLYNGWNLVSIPFIQTDTNLGSVLSSITGVYDAVQWYNISDNSDHWKHDNTKKPSHLNDLDSIDHTMGFWIHVTELGGVLFQYPGTQPMENQTINIYPGWNLVGYTSLTSHNRTVGLNNLTFDSDVDAIWTYNAATQKWKELGPSNNFELGRGYWVHSKVTKTWIIPL